MKTTLRTSALILAVAASANSVAGQSFQDEGREVSVADAARLEQVAEGLSVDPEHWSEAASLLRKAAALRPVGDETAIADLVQASRLSFYRGHEARALRDLKKAGERALAEGNVLAAANAFADAAWVAVESGEGTEAKALLVRAERLSHSPVLGAESKEELDRRFHRINADVDGQG